jgi:GntR family transcriptional regulator
MGSPMYRQIAEDLRSQIERGQLEPGQQLKTELELRERYNASRNTVRDAIKWLTALGLVETKPGQGTFVTRKIKPNIMDLTGDPEAPSLQWQADDSAGQTDKHDRLADPQVELQKASHIVSHQLGIYEGAQVVSRRQRRYILDSAGSIQTSFYPMDFAHRGADKLLQAEDLKDGSLSYLEQTLGLKPAGYRDWITVRTPDANETAFFNLPQDGRVEVFEVSRTAFDGNGMPMLLTVTVFPTDRSQFVVNVGEVPKDATLPETGSDNP